MAITGKIYFKQGEVIPASRWRPGVIWSWWHQPKDIAGYTPWGWMTKVIGAFFVSVSKPVGDGEIIVVGHDSAETRSAPEDFSKVWRGT